MNPNDKPPPYKRKQIIGDCTLYLADCRLVLPTLAEIDAVITDPPYGDTSLEWDSRVADWLPLVRQTLKPSASMWVFGSMRFFLDCAADFRDAGWRYAQDNVWEKHNGSGFHADRLKRVHEHAVHFYPQEAAWADIYKNPVTTPDAVAKTVRRKKRPPHMGHIDAGDYVSEDGGPRLMRSVQYVRSCHGYAEHPTQKPIDIIKPLALYSCPPGGRIVDPFMGSGTVGVVSAKLGMAFTGVEIAEGYFETACRRIHDAYAEPKQPDIFASPIPKGPPVQTECLL
jgi:site-specific DNA-methyltransferase (adenine-specific)